MGSFPISPVKAHPVLLDAPHHSGLVIVARGTLFNNELMHYGESKCQDLFPVATSQVLANCSKILCCGKASLVTPHVLGIVSAVSTCVICKDFKVRRKRQVCEINVS